MKQLLLILLLALPVGAVTNGYLANIGQVSEGTNWYGATTVYRGYNAWWEFRPHWVVGVVPNASTDLFDSATSGYTFTGTEAISGYAPGTVFIASAGTLPTGLFAMRGNAFAPYAPCNISGTTFSLRKKFVSTVDTSGTTVTYSDVGPDFTANLVSGLQVLINGSLATIASITDATHFEVMSSLGSHSGYTLDSACAGTKMLFSDNGTGEMQIDFDPAVQTAYITDVSGLPMGTTVSWFDTQPGGISGPLPATTKPYFFQGLGVGTMQAVLPIGATTGAYTVSITLCTAADGSGTCGTSTFGITVIALTPLTHSPPSSAPTIPGLSTWQTVMTGDSLLGGFGGQHWCDHTTGVPDPDPLSFGSETEVWYYDGGWVYYQIATYLSDVLWQNGCGANINGQYKDYVAGASGAVPGNRVFPNGLGRTFQLTGTSAYKTAVDLMTTGNLFVFYGGRLWDHDIRETAYAVNTYAVQEQLLGESRNANLVRSCEFLLSQLQAHALSGPHAEGQNFYFGLAEKALTDCFDLTADPRIPAVLKATADFQWGFYNASTHIMPYDVYASDTPWCNGTPNWFNGYNEQPELTSCNGTSDVTLRILNNLFDPTWAWIWQYTGDSTYQTEGDELFSQQFTNAAPFSGKEFSQSYRWSFSYVQLRSTFTQTYFGTAQVGPRRIAGPRSIP